MSPADLLISIREKLLDIASGSDRAQTLNPSTSLPGRTPGLRRVGQVAASDAHPVDGDPAAELVDLLHEVLSSGLADHGENVDYAALRASRAASCRPCVAPLAPLARSQRGSPLYEDFRRCTGKLHAFDPSALPDRKARLAFWINLYNILVLDGVIALGVRRSVLERGAGIGFFRQAAYVVGGQRMSCDDIEHGVLRANRGHPFYPGRQFRSSDPRLKWVIEPFEARVHFALNCASRSCPPIRAYLPEKVNSQLDLATRNYLATEVQILPEANMLRLSSIFKWFVEDFGGRDGIIEFVLSHCSDGAELLWLSNERDRVSLRYEPYDWSLNGNAQASPQSSQ